MMDQFIGYGRMIDIFSYGTKYQNNSLFFLYFFCIFVFLLSSGKLNRGKFHCHLRDLFAPLVIRYIDLMESSIAQSLHKGFQEEKWAPVE